MRSNAIISFFLAIAFFVIERIFLNNNAEFTLFMELQVVVIWSIAMIRSIRKFGLFSLFSLCLIGFFMFSIGGIFHFLISGDDIRYLERGFGSFEFSYKTIQEALWAYSVFIFCTYNIYSALYPQYSNAILRKKLSSNNYFFRIGKILMYTFLAFQIYKGYLYFTAFNANRVEIFLLGNMANPVPSWVRFTAYFFEFGYFFILASIPSEKYFKKYSLLYFIVLIPEILLGNRGMFGAFLLFYLWYYYNFYGKMAISLKMSMIGGGIMLIIFQLMEFMRDGANFSMSSFSFTRFLASQGVSFYILPIYIDFSDSMQYYLYPFFLYNILGGLTGYTGQSIEVLQHNCGVGHQLMYAINPSYYLAGASFGSSSITEIYDAGIIGFILLSVFFPLMLLFFERKMKTNRFFSLVSFVLVSHFILSARGSYFPSLYSLVKLYIFYQFILIIFKSLSINGGGFHKCI